ncbi:uncharacterized protein [Euwallacea similis]|uniref:uncharacterized protein isoform X2 n=1 Tax=Euwallacea similis TaxID=1736056 RepID=UPI0034507A78
MGTKTCSASADLSLKDSENPFIKLYKSAGQGIVDALQRDYLKEIRMYLIHKDSGELLEMYTLKVKYNKKDAKASRRTSEAKNATIEFLEALSNLPGKMLNENEVKVEFDLLYNEETPQEYEPPFFQAAKGQLRDVAFSQCVSLGNVDTGFHKISSYGRGKNFLISRATTPTSFVESVQEEPKNSVVELEEPKQENEDNEKPVSKKAKISNQTSFSTETWFDTICSAEAISLSSSEDGIQCLCEWSLPKQFSQIRCSHCFSRVHLACHGYLKEEDIKKDKFLCFCCSNNKKHVSLSSLKRLMKLRITLFGLHANKIIPEEIKCATGDDMTFLLTKLEEFGILQKNSTDNCWACVFSVYLPFYGVFLITFHVSAISILKQLRNLLKQCFIVRILRLLSRVSYYHVFNNVFDLLLSINLGPLYVLRVIPVFDFKIAN